VGHDNCRSKNWVPVLKGLGSTALWHRSWRPVEEWLWKRATLDKFTVLSQHFPGGFKENHEKLRIAYILAENATCDYQNTKYIHWKIKGLWINPGYSSAIYAKGSRKLTYISAKLVGIILGFEYVDMSVIILKSFWQTRDYLPNSELTQLQLSKS
jgi:hypothetical protein